MCQSPRAPKWFLDTCGNPIDTGIHDNKRNVMRSFSGPMGIEPLTKLTCLIDGHEVCLQPGIFFPW